jgi:hypothetical protein
LIREKVFLAPRFVPVRAELVPEELFIDARARIFSKVGGPATTQGGIS